MQPPRSIARSVADLLNSGARLQHISQRAKAAVALKEQVQAALPASLAGHITAASQRRQELVVSVDSPAFCARLRFEVPRLKAALMKTSGQPLDRVSVRVQPPPR
jgi:hypothetical protein